MMARLAQLTLLLSAAAVMAAPASMPAAREARKPKEQTKKGPAASKAARGLSRRRTQDGSSPLSFEFADLTVNNMGGWCNQQCVGVNEPATGYNIDIGSCGTSTADPFGNYQEAVTAFGDALQYTCDPDNDPHYMLFTGLGETDSGVKVDLRIRNLTEYVPFNANANRLNGEWGEINVLGNEPVDFEFCFIDHASGEYMKLDYFSFILTDFDNGITGYEEMLTIREDFIESYDLLGTPSEIAVSSYVIENARDSGAGDGSYNLTFMTFRSSVLGEGKDNPQEIEEVASSVSGSVFVYTEGSDEQLAQVVKQARSLRLNFGAQVDCFTLRIGVVWPHYNDKIDFSDAMIQANLSSLSCDGASNCLPSEYYPGNQDKCPGDKCNNGIYPAGTGRNIQIAVEGNLYASPDRKSVV